MHMPGHKGRPYLGFEALDITEVDGADVLYQADGIIKESEDNASLLFGCKTFYSAEGSSLAIRAMLALAKSQKLGTEKSLVIATRNVHKTFITAAALLDFDVEFIYSNNSTYHSTIVDDKMVEDAIKGCDRKPMAVYLTSPDYLGNILDIKSISKVCKKYDIPLLVDNAHGAYLKFLKEDLFPISLGADMCASSAHKTLPALTGAAYLHIANDTNKYFIEHAKSMMNLFSSTSPSYLILQSLDMTNKYIADNRKIFDSFSSNLKAYKERLKSNGYKLIGNEPMKITIDAKAYGYSGDMIAEYLIRNNIMPEFHDNDFVVLMPTPSNSPDELDYVINKLIMLPKKESILNQVFISHKHERKMSIKEATFKESEEIDVDNALGRILADTAVSCPPAIPILVCGEEIDEDDILMFKYYNIEKIFVVKK